MWAAFLASDSPAALSGAGVAYTSWQFGYSVEMGDRLVGLVLSGLKRATAGSVWACELDGEAMPQAGDYSVVTDGNGVARCVVRTTSVEVVSFEAVDEAHARAEGEGDLSLGYWRESHWDFYSRELEALGRTPERDMPVYCERFEVVYPADSAT